MKKIINVVKKLNPNTYKYQKLWAKRFIDSKNNLYSDEWGKIDSDNPGLGDYRKIQKKIKLLNSNKCIDIGCLDGKWSMELAKYYDKVICVDLTDRLSILLKSKLLDKFFFYKTKGNELNGINTNTIDLIFSMDSLVRCPKIDINKYLIEFYRVLKVNGSIILHLPCNEKLKCISKGFTSITCFEIKNMLKLQNFKNIKFDLKTLNHGLIVTAFK
jgi:ubiquinone/menaquinone biosynthesis C-methylase UbiE